MNSGHLYHSGCRGITYENCILCNGGLSKCIICGAAEGELLTFCPGYKLNGEAREACYNGRVVDLFYARQRRKLSKPRKDG